MDTTKLQTKRLIVNPESYPDVQSPQPIRRSGRLRIEIPILILGSDERGRVFSEQTHTVMVSAHGAGIVSSYKLIPEQELILRRIGSSREAEISVVGKIGEKGKLFVYGMKFVEEETNFWNVDFPEAKRHEIRPPVEALVCGECKVLAEIATGDFERDIYSTQGGLARFCDNCALITMWRPSQELGRTVPKALVKKQKEKPWETDRLPTGRSGPVSTGLVVLADAIDRAERRRKARAKVNFCAFVTSKNRADDIVACIDMSRGGVSFRSRNSYLTGARVEIAVPFSQEASKSQAIFVPARIANVTDKNDESGMRRFGIEFLKN